MEKRGAGHRDEERFTANLRRLREAKGWSQNELATRMRRKGWDSFRQTTISRLEKGEQSVRIGEARALASLLGVTVDDMALTASEEAEALARIREAVGFCTQTLDSIDRSGHLLPQMRADLRRTLATVSDLPPDVREAADRALTTNPVEVLTKALVLGEQIAPGPSDG